MRLVDADALEREMYRKSFEVDDGRQRWSSGLWIRYKIFEEAIRDAPTVETVKHGTWEHLPDYIDDLITCSVCGETFNVLDNDTYRFDYCPHCGARMDGDEKTD